MEEEYPFHGMFSGIYSGYLTSEILYNNYGRSIPFPWYVFDMFSGYLTSEI